MNKTLLSIVLGAIFVLVAMPSVADEVYICSHADKQRVITISYDVEGQSIPCEVHYEKDTGKKRLGEQKAKQAFAKKKRPSSLLSKKVGVGLVLNKKRQHLL